MSRRPRSAPERDRLNRLPGDGRDVFEVTVAMEHGEAGAFAHGGEHQIGKAGGTVLATPRQRQHHLGGPVPIGLTRAERCRDSAALRLVELEGGTRAAQPCRAAMPPS